jgi:FMN-dependent NADH-azoreductase
MPTLLHLDSSLNGANSVSRTISAAFAEHWRTANPDGEYRYRDLAADPLPHLDQAAHGALTTPEADRTAEQRQAWQIIQPLVEDLTAADVVVIGLPMYNFTIPSTVKAWLDRLAVPEFRAGEDGRSVLSDKLFVVTTSRGGSYAPGTPRESYEFQESYLRKYLGFLGVADNLVFVNTEMTLAPYVPALAQFQDVHEKSLADAHATVRELATTGLVPA